MKLVYLEAGSGAPEPVPDRLIRAVREAVEIPVVVGGGIRTPEAAKAATHAGADIVVTGTIVEVARDGGALRRIIETPKAGRYARRPRQHGGREGCGDAPGCAAALPLPSP